MKEQKVHSLRSQTRQTCTAAGLGAVEDYHRTQLQWSVWSERQLAPSGDHFDGDSGSNAFPLLLVDFATK